MSAKPLSTQEVDDLLHATLHGPLPQETMQRVFATLGRIRDLEAACKLRGELVEKSARQLDNALEREQAEKARADALQAEKVRALGMIKILGVTEERCSGYVEKGIDVYSTRMGKQVSLLNGALNNMGAERDALKAECVQLRGELLQLRKDALPDPHDGRDVSLDWLRERIRKANKRTALQPQKEPEEGS